MAFTSTTSSRVDYIVSIDDNTYSRYKIWVECSDLRDNLDTFLDKSLQNVDFRNIKYDRQFKDMKSKTYIAEAFEISVF